MQDLGPFLSSLSFCFCNVVKIHSIVAKSELNLPSYSRVDSRVFIAVSRCTYKAIFVECGAATVFARHFEISRATKCKDNITS